MAGTGRRGRPRKQVQNNPVNNTVVHAQHTLNSNSPSTSTTGMIVSEAQSSNSPKTVIDENSKVIGDDTAINNPLKNPDVEEALSPKLNPSASDTQPPEPQIGPKTWKSLFTGNRLSENGLSLNYIPPVIENGQIVVQLDEKAVESENAKWKCVTSHPRPAGYHGGDAGRAAAARTQPQGIVPLAPKHTPIRSCSHLGSNLGHQGFQGLTPPLVFLFSCIICRSLFSQVSEQWLRSRH